MKYENVLFDLDGTVTDSSDGVINSVVYSLNKFGIHDIDRNELYAFIGPPLRDSYSRYYGITGDTAERVVASYREYYERDGILENTVYDGVEKILIYLNEKKANVFLATSKPEVYARKIMKRYGIDKYFKDIVGSNLDGTRENKEEVISHLIEKNELKDLSNIVMIGDRKYDILGAKSVGIDSIGILYGYGVVKEFEEAGATHIIEDTKELLEFFKEEAK